MKYEIFSTYIYDDFDHLIETYPCLNDFGFRIESKPVMGRTRIRDETGQLIWFEECRMEDTAYVDIQDLEDLSLLIKAVKEPLVIGEGETNRIEIYDGYRE